MNPGEAEAIPNDDATAEQAEEQQKSPRDEMMKHIIEQREQRENETPEVSSQEQELFTVKIDGIEQQIPIDQARATIQKNMAADKRLNEAALKQQQLQQWEQRLAQQEQQLQQAPTNNVDTTEVLQTAVDAMYDGDTDNAVKALAEAIGGRTQATHNPDEISDQVMRKLAKREFDTDVNNAASQFKTDFPDIAADAHLWNMTDQKTIDLMGQHPEWSPTQINTEAGRQTRQWVQNVSGQGYTQPNRAERKSQLQSLPRSTGSVAYQPPVRNDGPQTPAQVIANMKQSRGQA